MTTTHLATQLTRLALPLIPQHGFTSQTLLLASSSLPGTRLSTRTLDALYPSPPTSIPSTNSFSLKGLAIGNGGKRSLSRTELIALAKGKGLLDGNLELRGREKTGPARALLKEWLEQGRREMRDEIIKSGFKGEQAIKRGIKYRLMYNESVLDKLPQALALLSAPTTTALTNPISSTILPPSPLPHLQHVASIAQDLAKISGSEAQGTAWYALRTRLSLIYSLSELHLLSPPPSSSSSESTTPTPRERIQSSIEFSEKLWRETGRVGDSVRGIEEFGNWVVKSWMGLARSRGI